MLVLLLGAVGLTTALALTLVARHARAVDNAPCWVDNPNYHKLGAVSATWLSQHARRP